MKRSKTIILLLILIINGISCISQKKVDNSTAKNQLKKNKKAVVHIKNGGYSGTGFLISDKIVISAGHVFSKEGDVSKVEFHNGKNLFSRVIYINDYDQAVLKILGEAPDSSTHLDLVQKNYSSYRNFSNINYSDNKLTIHANLSVSRKFDYPFSDVEYYIDQEVLPGSSGSPLIISGTNDVIGVLSKRFNSNNYGIFIPAYYLTWNSNRSKKKR